MRAGLLIGSVAALLSGCASPVYDGKYPWDEGWRIGEVERVGRAADLGGRHTYDCRHKMPESAVSSSRFAVLFVEQMPRHRHQVVPIEAGRELTKGDRVLTNVRRCDPPLPRSGG